MVSGGLVICLLMVFLFNIHAIKIPEVIDNIPEDERLDFVMFHAARGYNLIHNEKSDSQTNKVYDAFSINLYNCLIEYGTFEHICHCGIMGNGGCVNVCDPGVRPNKLNSVLLSKCN